MIVLRRSLPAVVLLFAAAAAWAQLAIPAPPTRRINDYAGALSAAHRDRLEQKLADRERASSNQVVVAIFPSLRGESLEDYSIRLAQSWRIGQKGLDNGVIFLVFLQDRKMRIEVGYGLEATLTDAIAGSIIRDVVAPRFREGRLADGIGAGLDAIDRAIAGAYTAPVRRARCDTLGAYLSDPRRCTSANPTPLVILGFVILGGLLLGTWAYAQAPRQRRRGLTGGRDGWSVFDTGPGRSSRGGWSSSDSGSFGSSSGGFSGGGGSFGGGGASGSW